MVAFFLNTPTHPVGPSHCWPLAALRLPKSPPQTTERTRNRTTGSTPMSSVKAPTASPAATSTVNGKHKKQLNGDVAASENIPPRNWPSTPTLTDKSANNKTQLGIKETVFLIGAVITVLYCGSWAVELADIVEERQARKPDYPYPKFEDFLIAFQALAVISFFRVVLTNTVLKSLGQVMVDSKYTGDVRQDKVDKFASVSFKFLFFAIYSVLGVYLLVDKEWTMPALGGTGHLQNLFVGYPYQEQFPYVKEYYMVSLAYHAHSLLFHVFSTKRNDFIEMLLHHIVAVLLICFSYMLNVVRGGSIIILLHDLADVPGYLVKSSVDTPFKYFTLTVYLSLLAAWGYLRLYVFPFEIIIPIIANKYPVIHESLQKDGNFLLFFMYMLVTLQVMHVLWYGLFIKMGLNFLSTGKTEDIQQRKKSKLQ